MTTGEYVPTTEVVRLYYTGGLLTASEVGAALIRRSPDEFDRWLRLHDSEQQEQALREAAERFNWPDGDTSITYEFVNKALRARADRLAAERGGRE